MSKCYVTAIITPKAGQEEALKKATLDNIPLVRKEPGCLRYDLHALAEGGKFLFYEIWADKAALDVHAASAHMARYHEKTDHLLAGPLEIRIWSALDTR
ncbi:MAG: antibiotic biosynthesis monooxygenase [Desulfovibrio sp.]|jgi:quinol monooxygenase YgiN|nr:antibiotic biosynthesis monooxygenase [Desulfovibrio sp.]